MAAQVPQNLTADFIKSNLLTLAQTSFYGLTLPLPSAVRDRAIRNALTVNGSTSDLHMVELLCTDAALPGSSLAVHDVTEDYHGVSEKMAFRRIYDQSMNLTFYVDRNYDVIELFETWIDYISGNDDRGMSKNRHRNFRMRYPDSYRSEIYLTKFEKDQHSFESQANGNRRELLNYSFIGAFPQSITSMPVSYNTPDILKCNVSFSFIRYVVERAMGSLQGATAAKSSTMRTSPPVTELNLSRDVTDQIAKDNAQYGNTFPAGSFGISPTQNKKANKVLRDDFLPYIK
tara:strand:+ start:670 stop:1533 length:864 start_codon:yes stop_codon:yes gene_type:complete